MGPFQPPVFIYPLEKDRDFRYSIFIRRDGGIGRHKGLKIPRKRKPPCRFDSGSRQSLFLYAAEAGIFFAIRQTG